jgi:hypothetical protein
MTAVTTAVMIETIAVTVTMIDQPADTTRLALSALAHNATIAER